MQKIVKTNKLLSILFFVIIIGVYSCRKYDDGPALSLRSKTARVTGTWEVEYLGVNGADSTQAYKNSRYYARYVFEKTKSGDKIVEYQYINISVIGLNKSEWFFSSRKGYKEELCVQSGLAGLGSTFLIKRLTEKQMWLEGVSYGNGIRGYLKLKKLKK